MASKNTRARRRAVEKPAEAACPPPSKSPAANPPKRRPLLLAMAIGLLAVWFAAMLYVAIFIPSP
jgi:hypothetical protein